MRHPPLRLRELQTPCLVLERPRLQRNIERMQARLRRHGVALRPHAKTVKSAPILQLMSEGQERGIAVATMREAEYLYHQGFTEILYAVGIAPQKLAAVQQLRDKGADVIICLDSIQTVTLIDDIAAGSRTVFPVLVEIDCDGRRAGVAPASDAAMRLLENVHASRHLRYCGLLTHAGGAYECRSIQGIVAAADAERSAVATTAAAYANRGVESDIRSVGSTPTALYATSFEGINEVRAGCFAFQDLTTVALGVCTISDIAISVLATVIGHQRARNRLIVDAGWSALSEGGAELPQGCDRRSFGVVCDAAGQSIASLNVVAVDQEHGMVTDICDQPVDFRQLPIGAMIRILPVHASAAASGFDAYYVVSDSDEVDGVWPRLSA